MKIRLIIAGSRTVDPTDDEIEAAVLAALRAWGIVFLADDLSGDVSVMTIPGVQYISSKPLLELIEVICGKADGADAAGARWARSRGIAVHEDPVTDEDRRAHGPYLAPKMRNRRMAERGTHALIFWDGRSGGSADMACRMVAREKPVRVIPTRRRAPRRRQKRAPAPNDTVGQPSSDAGVQNRTCSGSSS